MAQGKDFLHDTGMLHGGEPMVKPVVVIDQFLVIQTQQMENGSMEITYTHSILHGVVTKLIGSPVNGLAGVEASIRGARECNEKGLPITRRVSLFRKQLLMSVV